MEGVAENLTTTTNGNSSNPVQSKMDTTEKQIPIVDENMEGVAENLTTTTNGNSSNPVQSKMDTIEEQISIVDENMEGVAENLTTATNGNSSNPVQSKTDTIEEQIPIVDKNMEEVTDCLKTTTPTDEISALRKQDSDVENILVVDYYYIVRITMCLCGVCTLFPWNCFVLANSYWMFKFRNVSDSDPKERSELQTIFFKYIQTISILPLMLSLLLNIVVINRIRSVTKVRVTLFLMIFWFGVVMTLIPINTDKGQWALFVVLICIIIAINATQGFFEGTCLGIAATFPEEFTGYTVIGMALGGLVSSIVQVLALVGKLTSMTNTIIYYVSAISVLVSTLLCFQKAVKTDFYIYHISKQVKSNQNILPGNIALLLQVLKKIALYAISVTLNFWITLSVFPSIFCNILSTAPEQDQLFIPISFMFFNACDLLGRIVAFIQEIPARYIYITLLVTILRSVFVPLILFCNAQPRSHLPVLFYNGSYYTITFVFGFTNGFVTYVLLSQAPKKVNEKYQELVGSLMAFFLGLGLTLGFSSSSGISKLY